MSLTAPFVWINFKTYPGTAGEEGLELARTIERVGNETGVQFVVSPAQPDLRLLARKTDLPIMGQHADAVDRGRGMGRVVPATLAGAGADAVVINHAERRATLDDIVTLIDRSTAAGLHTVLGAHRMAAGRAAVTLAPDTIVFEVPADIASDRAVTHAHPDRVRAFASMVGEAAPETNVFVGGGISTGEHVARAFELGADAVGAASAVVTADEPSAVLSDLASGVP